MAQRVRGITPTRPPRAKRGRPQPHVVGPFSILADKLIIAAAVCAGGALAYLIYGLASGRIGAFPQFPGMNAEMSDAAQAAFTLWVATATKILVWGALVGALLALARYYESLAAIVAVGVIGGFLYIGLPTLVGIMLQQTYHSANALTTLIVISAQAMGKVVLIVTAARGAAHVFLAAAQRSRRRRAPHAPMAPARSSMRPRSLLRPCWDLDRCRSSTSACPRYQERRSCWKVGSGCLCDMALAEKMVPGAEAWSHEEAVATRYRAGAGRAPCRTCPIFEEHQDYKFRILAWLAYPATVAVMYLARSYLHIAYERSLDFAERTMAMLAFIPEATDVSFVGGVQSAVLSSNVEWVFMACLWLLLLSYVLQGVEHVTFRWGW